MEPPSNRANATNLKRAAHAAVHRGPKNRVLSDSNGQSSQDAQTTNKIAPLKKVVKLSEKHSGWMGM